MDNSLVSVMFWNVENLFHPNTGGPRFDMTPVEGWTHERYDAKTQRLASVIESITSDINIPYIVGLAEIENQQVITDLQKNISRPLTLACDPEFVDKYFDCVVLYDSTYFNLIKCKYFFTFERFDRGEFVQVDLQVKANGALLTVFCCHLKARPSMQSFTQAYRQATSDNIQAKIWSMHDGMKVRSEVNKIKDPDAPKPNSLVLDKNIIVMGDFNDEPFSSSITDYLCASHDKQFVAKQAQIDKVSIYNCSWEQLLSEKPGSYYHKKAKNGPWSMIDQIMVTPALLNGSNGLKYNNSFSVVNNLTANEQGVPVRICEWDNDDNIVWNDNGFSDHFPVKIEIEFS